MAASSLSSSAAAPKKYDVFISFRGEDTREGFTAHLYDAFCRSSIEAYIDRELNKGDEISPSLFQAIEGSYGSLVVFSENYASSKWCLNELVKILECRKQGHFVIPVFYNINPSEVRNHNASYGEAFAKHEQNFKNKAMLEKWKAALVEAANIVGWDSQSRNHRDESELIENIVKDVLQKLDYIDQPSKLGLVGIDNRCDCIEALLQKFPVVGIWGIGGIGKTTLAKSVFDKLSSQYDSCYFFENVREESQRRGPNQLRNKLLFELLKDDIFSVKPHKVVGLKHATRRLSNKKVFIVLDDVNNFEQSEYLVQECKSLGPESRVIITTRDRHLLASLGVKHGIYEVEELNFEESLELFRSKAFNEDYPEMEYEEITKKFIRYTKGTPIALKVLGSFLFSKTKEEWESAWKKLKKIPNEDIEQVLRLSFDGLNHEDQEIFLDIACFSKGKCKEEVIRLLDAFGFHGAIGVRTLQDRALITLSFGDIVQMHDLIQEMGWEIVRKEYVKEPGSRSRLWDPEEVYDVLKYDKGTHNVEGISLDMSQIKDLHLSANSFKKMINLRYLDFYSPFLNKSGKIHADKNTHLFSNKLAYLRWDKCPLQSLSSNFCAEKLVEVNMPGSHLKRLWNGVQDLVNLKSLNLSESEQLVELPNFSKASSLKLVRLSSCTNLCHIHPSILSSHTLETLDVSWCKKLESLQSEVHLKSLEDLSFSNCSSLKKFSLSSEKLKYLSIWGTTVEILHSSIGLCKNLESLTLCDSLKNVPSNLSNLASLKSLIVIGCTKLDSRNLHILLGSLLSLREIKLMDCWNLSQIPDNIKYLSYLTFLDIRSCERLLYIPELPASIETVWLVNCTSLETIMTPKSSEYKPSCYFLPNCVKLGEDSLSSIMKLTYFRIKEAAAGVLCEDVSTYEGLSGNHIFFPGSRVPCWLGYRAAQNWISIEIPPCSHLLGIAFYYILSPKVLPYGGESLVGQQCCCYLQNSESTVFASLLFSLPFRYGIKLISDHVCIWYDRWDCNYLFDEMENPKIKGQITKKLSFEFFVGVREKTNELDNDKVVWIDNAIKECGVWPIYASDYDYSINDSELRKEMKLGYRTDDIDEQVVLQFDDFLSEYFLATGFTRSVFDLQDQDISSQNVRFTTTQVEVNLESEFGDKGKRCQNTEDHRTLQRKKFAMCQDIGELLGGASTSGIGVGCSEFALQPLAYTNTMNKFIFELPRTDISMQNAWVDSTQRNSTYLLDRFSEFDNSIMQFSQTGFCPDLNKMPTGVNSLDIDQQSTSLSLQLNQGHPQMNPFDMGDNSGLYVLSSPVALPDTVQMAQANNDFGSSSFCLNQENPQMNLFKGIEVGGSCQEKQPDQEQLVTGN